MDALLQWFRAWMAHPSVRRMLIGILGILLVQAVVYFLKRAVGPRIKDPNSRYRIRKGLQFLGYGAMALQVSILYREQLGGLTVVLGVAGAGIAFALQEVIASVAGWAAISFGGFFEVGDRVQLGGIKGDVIDIGILRTTLMELGQWVDGDLYNGRIVRVANSFLFKEPVFNYSGDFPFLWDELKVPVKYGCDHRLARRVLQEVAEGVVGDFAQRAEVSWKEVAHKYRVEDARIGPMVSLVANDNWMEFTLRYPVDFKARRITKDRLFEGILDRFSAQPEALQLASATFQLVEAPPLRVRVEAGGAS